MNPEFNPLDPALEQAISEIRDEGVDPAVVEGAAARVWEKLAKPAALRSCADFQALLPDFRAGRLPEARATLVQDHLHECVACRRVYEGRTVVMPERREVRRITPRTRWALAASVLLAVGVSVWLAVGQFAIGPGRAFVESVNGTLYAVSATGIRPIAAGQDLPDGIEIRSAKDTDAMLALRDGSTVELRERSGLSTTETGRDLTIHLSRGSIIVQAAKRRAGHLYVATADCRVAVTGTVFSVSAGVKGSRVSVIQGEVRVSQDNRDHILYPGEQVVTSSAIEPLPVKDDIAWSRNRERLFQQLSRLKSSLWQIHLPALRYGSRLLGRLPGDTLFFASIPNLADYLGQAQSVFRRNLAQSPELRAWWAGQGTNIDPMLEKLRAGSEYLGDEIAIVGVRSIHGPVFLAETKRDGFPEFLKKVAPGFALETRNGLVAFGPVRDAVEAVTAGLDSSPGFSGTPFYARIAEAYRDGAGVLFCHAIPGAGAGAPQYIVAEEKEVSGQSEIRADVSFAGERTGMAGWLAAPAPMGGLDYISPEATVVAAFVVKNPAAIIDQALAIQQRSTAGAEKALAEIRQQAGFDVRQDLAAGLGGEFALALDGPAFPVPSWKLVVEVYDPARFQAALEKIVDACNQRNVQSGGKPLRTGQETVDGRTYYMIAGSKPNPLTQVYYTFNDGYLIAGPTRALVAHALQVKTAGISITHSAQWLAMEPRDQYTNFSAVIYQNLGKTLAPLAGLLGAFQAPTAHRNPLEGLGDMKPVMIAAYGEPDRITVAASGNLFGNELSNMLSGNVLGALGGGLPVGRWPGARP